MRWFAIPAAVTVASVVASATPTRADATLFAGAFTSGGVRPIVGVSVGSFPRDLGGLFGFELDFARTRDRSTPSTPEITTFGGNMLVQSPVIGRRLRLYGTGGIAIYGATTGHGGSGVGGSGNVGGGTKINMAGPLWLRLDYRVFLIDNAQTLQKLS